LLDRLPFDKIGKYLEGSVEKIFDTTFSTLDGIEGEVKVLQDRDLQMSKDKLAQEIIDEASKHTAVIGSTAALPDLLPTSWPALIPSICTDFGLTLRTQLAMLLKLAYLYGPDLSREDRKREAVGILASYGSTDEGEGSSATTVSKDMFLVGSKHIGGKALVVLGRKLGERFIRKKLASVIPVIGIAISGGVNYLSTRNLGNYSRQYYSNRRYSDTETASLSEEVTHFQRCFLQVLVNMAKVDKVVSDEERRMLKDSLMMFGYSPTDQARWMSELDDLESAQALDGEDLERLTDDDRRFILKQAMCMMFANRQKSVQESNYLEVLRKKFHIDGDALASIEGQVKTEMGLTD